MKSRLLTIEGFKYSMKREFGGYFNILLCSDHVILKHFSEFSPCDNKPNFVGTFLTATIS